MLKIGVIVAAACAFSTLAQARECKTIAAAGDGLTKDIAVLMSTNGLKNIIDYKGLHGVGKVKTSCNSGPILTECRSAQRACK
jgi:hypothetical protein